MLKKTVKKLLLIIPEIRNLVQERTQLKDERDALLQERDALLQENKQLQEEREVLLQQRDILESERDYYLSVKEQGRLIETDYPYFPQSREWNNNPAIIKLTQKIAQSIDKYKVILNKFSQYEDFFLKIAVHENDAKEVIDPHWLNPWFPSLDAITLYGLLVEMQPRYYVEVGSGNSTKFARKAINDHQLSTKIISIDPYPRAEIDSICEEIIRQPLEQVDYTFFENLSEEDILFIDNSHRSFSNSDVTVFFMEILGNLPTGMIYGIHDIFFPYDYPETWKNRYYNEQYLLASYLLGGANGDEILLPNHYLQQQNSLPDSLNQLFLNPILADVEVLGGIFWMQRNL
jgi:hypothetical protein